MAKYGMSMCVLGMAEEFKEERIAVNALWPKTGKSDCLAAFHLVSCWTNARDDHGGVRLFLSP